MDTIQLNTIYNEDCLETMKRMPDNFVDLVLTDPPYGSDFHYALKSMIKNERQEQIEADFLCYRKELHAVEGYSTDEQDLIRVRDHQLRELENEL